MSITVNSLLLLNWPNNCRFSSVQFGGSGGGDDDGCSGVG